MNRHEDLHHLPWLESTRTAYDIDAAGYAEQVRGLLGAHPVLRAQLDTFVELVRGQADRRVVDVGCGTGYVTQYLYDQGVGAFGIDLSPAMIEIARSEHPTLEFSLGTMTSLDLESQSVSGLVAFWSTIHIPDSTMPGVIAEFERVLCPGGWTLIGFHVGDGVEHTSTGYSGHPISVDSYRRNVITVSNWLRDYGFLIESELLLKPDDDAPGALVLARRPAG